MNAWPITDGKDHQSQVSSHCNGDSLSKSRSNYLGTIFRFIINVNYLESSCIESSDIILSDVSWKVKFCKGRSNADGKNDTNALDFELSSVFGENTATWSCKAFMTLKLFHKNGQDNSTLVLNLSEQMFSNTNASFGIKSFLSWDTFLEQYVQNNEASFEIEMSTTPLILKVSSEVEQIYTKFLLILDHRSKLRESFLPEVIVRGIKWRIHTKTLRNDTVCSHLQAVDIGTNWSYKVSASISIVNENGPAYTYKFNHTFSRESSEAKPKNIMLKNVQHSDFVNLDEISNMIGKTVLLVEIKVDEPKPLWKPERGIKSVAEYNAQSRDEQKLPCSVCSNRFTSENIFVTDCGHLYCTPCRAKNRHSLCHSCKKIVYNIHPIYY